MAALAKLTGPSPAQLAHVLLDAWLCSDQRRFSRAFEARSEIVPPVTAHSDESERWELLDAVAGRIMNSHATPGAQSRDDPGVEWCVEMLKHLASSEERRNLRSLPV